MGLTGTQHRASMNQRVTLLRRMQVEGSATVSQERLRKKHRATSARMMIASLKKYQ